MPPGKKERFLAPDNITELTVMIERFGTMELSGSYRDAIGDEHPATGRIDLKELWELNVEAIHLRETNYEQKTADELEKIRRELGRRRP